MKSKEIAFIFLAILRYSKTLAIVRCTLNLFLFRFVSLKRQHMLEFFSAFVHFQFCDLVTQTAHSKVNIKHFDNCSLKTAAYLILGALLREVHIYWFRGD